MSFSTNANFAATDDFSKGKFLETSTKRDSILDEVAYPIIESRSLVVAEASWNLYYDADFKSVLEAELTPELLRVFEHSTESFRRRVTVQGIPFLIAIFARERIVRFYTPRMTQELFLLKEIGLTDDRIPKRHAAYREFKRHVHDGATLDSARFPSIIDQLTRERGLTDFTKDEVFPELEKKTARKVDALLPEINRYKSSLFEKVSDWGLRLTADYSLIRVHLLKFLVILPWLHWDASGTEVKRVLLEAMRRVLEDSEKARQFDAKGQDAPLPPSIERMLRMAHFKARVLPARPLFLLTRSAVRTMARRFIAGETIQSAKKSIQEIRKTNRDVTLDQLGELVVSEVEADAYRDQVLELIRGFKEHIQPGEKNAAGILRAHVSIKLSALSHDFKPHAIDETYAHLAPRLQTILLEAKKEQVFINVDAEHYAYRDATLEIFGRVLLETDALKEYADCGIVLQAYLRDADAHLNDILALARKRGLCMPVRLVKGAYWDAETTEADAHSFDAPEFLNKEETDIHFRQMVVRFFENPDAIQLCLASHNFNDHCFAEALREAHYPDLPIIEHQCLHMTYEALSNGMAQLNWVVRNYVPVADLLVGMAYLVRRIMENSSQVGVLTIMRSHQQPRIVQTPSQIHADKKQAGELVLDPSIRQLRDRFFNCAPMRPFLKQEREILDAAYADFKENGIGFKAANPFELNGPWQTIHASSDPTIEVGSIQLATESDADRAIEQAADSYANSDWSAATALARASVLVRAANILQRDRAYLSALISYEAGKAIIEALADVDEAIDFLNLYARDATRLHKNNPHWVARGVVAAITPWNFPFAIPCGMAVSALVAGNPVILKSAEQTPLTAAALVERLHEAGVPKNALIHLPGPGETVGKRLVEDPRVAGYSFTGSKPVGQLIAKTAGKRLHHNQVYGSHCPTRVVTEMGGKNAVIVTANAELDEAVAGILYSAFAHAGQKCSAASRILVDRRIKERLAERLTEAMRSLYIGKAWDWATAINPVITEADQSRIRKNVREAIEEAQSTGGKVWLDRSEEALDGYCVGPSLIEIDSTRATNPESMAQREIFGPVVHLIPFNDLDEAIALFNSTEYGLTGGVFSQSQDDIDFLSDRMEAGNLYINRNITGARVGIEPFGGFKNSGTGPKAGCRATLLPQHLSPPRRDPETQDQWVAESDQAPAEAPQADRRAWQEREPNVLTGIKETIYAFESFYPGVFGYEKDLLIHFGKWVRYRYGHFLEEGVPNVEIPGQVSRNDYRMIRSRLGVVAESVLPDLAGLFHLLAATVAGSGIRIVAVSEGAHDWWSRLARLLQKAGIPETQIQIVAARPEDAVARLGSGLDSVLLSADQHYSEKFLKDFYEQPADDVATCSVYSSFDAHDLRDVAMLMEQHAHVRSFAVNLMRHGASMGIEFEKEPLA